MWRINAMIFACFGRLFKFSIYKCEPESYEWMVQDDFIDIKNFHNMDAGTQPYRKMKKMLKKRIRYYVRHGFFDLAEDIDTAFWVLKETK